jgi:hypothetical protein
MRLQATCPPWRVLFDPTIPPSAKDEVIEVEAIAAIDPGVRVPFTVYSPEGSVVEVQQTGFGQTFAKHRQKQEASAGCSRTGDG